MTHNTNLYNIIRHFVHTPFCTTHIHQYLVNVSSFNVGLKEKAVVVSERSQEAAAPVAAAPVVAVEPEATPEGTASINMLFQTDVLKYFQVDAPCDITAPVKCQSRTPPIGLI